MRAVDVLGDGQLAPLPTTGRRDRGQYHLNEGKKTEQRSERRQLLGLGLSERRIYGVLATSAYEARHRVGGSPAAPIRVILFGYCRIVFD